MASIDPALYESARLDGANRWQQFRHVTVTYLIPTLSVVLVLVVKQGLMVFDYVKAMTGGGPGTATHVLVYYIYTTAFTFYRMGYAASMSWILFIILFMITLVQWREQKKWVSY